MALFNPATSYRHLLSAYTDAQGILTLPPETILRSRATISAWSPAHHLMHIVKSNEVIQRYVHAICSSDSSGARGGRASPIGFTMLMLGRIPRRAAQAEPSIQPPEHIDAGELRLAWEESEAAVRRLDDLIATLPLHTGRRSHYVFGSLTATQWLRFSVIHTRHHLRIIRDVLERGDE